MFGIFLNSAIITVLTIGLASQGLSQEQSLMEATVASGSFATLVFLSTIQLGFLLWLVRGLITKFERKPFSWSMLGLSRKDRSKNVSPGIVLAVAISLSTIGIGYFAGTLEYFGNGLDLFGPSQTSITILLGAVLALASGVGEEVAFRGYLQSRIAQRYSPAVAVVVVAVVFALSHPVGDVSYPLLYFVTAVLVGILFGTLFVRTGSLWMGVALHTVWNYLQIAIVAVRDSADGRFFGAPLIIFDNISGMPYMLVELGVILVVLLSVILFTRPVTKRDAIYTH
jgi:membrane protease YdiL (CAAX protease family)